MSTLPITVGIELLEDLEDKEFSPQEAQEIVTTVWQGLISALMFGVMIKTVNKVIREKV